MVHADLIGTENTADALKALSSVIQNDRDLVRELVGTLVAQVEDCREGPEVGPGEEDVTLAESEDEDADEVAVNTGRALQTTPNATTSNATIVRYRSNLQKLIRTSNRRNKAQTVLLRNLTAQFASLRNLTLSSQGLVIGFGGNASSSIEINTATTVIDAVQRRVGAAAASLPSMRIIVGTFNTDVNNVLTTIQSQTNVIGNAHVSVNMLDTDITNIQTTVSSLESADTASTNKLIAVQNKFTANQNTIANLESTVSSASAAVDDLASDVATNAAKLTCVGTPATATEFTISGCNVHILNGADATDTVNGKGNLIIGMDEEGECQTPSRLCPRTGSHNLVVGTQHQYQSFAGIVAGSHNAVTQPYSTVTAGTENKATASTATVAGGCIGTASGVGSSINGGEANEATARGAVVSGGRGNKALHQEAIVTGGIAQSTTAAEAVI
jgi:hypothetical protein